jgi:hypothetical protein
MQRFASPLRSSLVLAVALLVVSGTNAEAAVRWGLSGFTGYQGYSMDEINSQIIEINEFLSQPGDLVQIDELNGDASFGAGIKADLNPNWRVYAEYEHLSDNTGGGNLIGSFTIDVSSETYLVGATYFLPSKGKARVGIGAGAGYYDFRGDVGVIGEAGTTPISESMTTDGSTIGFHGRADLDVALSEKAHLDLALGYRAASGEIEKDLPGTSIDLDWSGFMSRVGFTFFVK